MKHSVVSRLISAVLLAAFALAVLLFPWAGNYSSPSMWAHYDHSPDHPVDVFIVGATADWGEDGTYQTSTVKHEDRYFQKSLLNMQAGLYWDECNVFAPYYRQACLSVYYRPDAERAPYFHLAYQDVRKAFLWYLVHINDGRPFILAGFSQGADLALRLMQEFFDDESLSNQLVAAYLIGWRVVQEDLESFPFLHMAQGEDDTGVIVAFSSEAEFVKDSIILREGGYTYGINPLNWRTDSTPADKSENPGSCSIRMDGSIANEVAGFTGCYRSPERGTLIVTDVDPNDYLPDQPLFCVGCYHNQELKFYYRSVHDNVKTRVDSYLRNP